MSSQLRSLVDCIRFVKGRDLIIRDVNFINYMNHKFEKVDFDQINDFGTPYYNFTEKIIYSTSNDFIYLTNNDNNKIKIFYIQLTGHCYFWKYILENDKIKLNIDNRMITVREKFEAIYNTQISVKILLNYKSIEQVIITFITCLWKQNNRFFFLNFICNLIYILIIVYILIYSVYVKL